MYPKDAVPETKYLVELIDYIPYKGPLGYHTTGDGGKFLITIGVETILEYPNSGLFQRKSMDGRTVSNVLAHEILETIGNPYVNREVYTYFLPIYTMTIALTYYGIDTNRLIKEIPSIFTFKILSSKEPIFKFYNELTKDEIQKVFTNDKTIQIFLIASVRSEVCNPVQRNKIDELVNGREIEVSDFITPDWFVISAEGPYNYKKTLTQPFELDIGGYVDFFIRNVDKLKQEQFYMMRLE